ncbi:Solute carrier family 40 protein [Mycena kentingensis (nom. inval.)]|nr:Solute carrier family 40 protein [Mycena kentingensis (nom. inval.)]
MSSQETPLLASEEVTLDPLPYSIISIDYSAWGDKTAEFALYLSLILCNKDTLLPSSIFGFVMTLTGILFSRYAGNLVDKFPKLTVVRAAIIAQKLSALGAYACVAGLHLLGDCFAARSWAMFSLLLLSGCLIQFSNTTISIAVERDWTACLAAGSSTRLSPQHLPPPNKPPLQTPRATLRVLPHPIIAALTLAFEVYWIQSVYARFPALKAEQRRKAAAPSLFPTPAAPSSFGESIRNSLDIDDRKEFVRLPVFLSSVSISFLYLTVLSFDGIMLGYLKTLDFRDDFLAEMHGLCVITELIGTLITVPLENKLGSIRAGSWSVWSMVLCLLLVLAAFNLFSPSSTSLSIGLQEALSNNARRNTITALQYTMQSVLTRNARYVLTMILSRPSQFRYASLVSFLGVLSGATVYLLYLKKERGHIFHSPHDWLRKIL